MKIEINKQDFDDAILVATSSNPEVFNLVRPHFSTTYNRIKRFCLGDIGAEFFDENEDFQHLGSVATNNGYSDWATTEIDAGIKSMWYRFSRREDDFCIECAEDGIKYKQMRICHMYKATDEITFGIYACSPEDSSFKATFTNMEITDCKWPAHNGQAPDEE